MARPKATSLSDINFAFTGEQNTEVFNTNVQDNISRIASEEAAPTESEYVVFKLVNTKKAGGTYIPNIDDVINPETKKVERIRLLSGVDSIWLKDQKDVTQDYVRQNSRSLDFPRGAKCMRIPTWDKTALEFARICRHNIGSPNRKSGSKFEFFEYNPAKQAEEALKQEELEIEMAIEVKGMSDFDVKKYASFLGLRFNDEIGELKPPALIRKDLMMYAKRNPILFQKLIGERKKEVDVNYLVKKAIIEAKIDIGSTAGKAFWSNGGGLIGIIPASRKPAEYLTELACTNNEEGRQFLQQLQMATK